MHFISMTICSPLGIDRASFSFFWLLPEIDFAFGSTQSKRNTSSYMWEPSEDAHWLTMLENNIHTESCVQMEEMILFLLFFRYLYLNLSETVFRIVKSPAPGQNPLCDFLNFTIDNQKPSPGRRWLSPYQTWWIDNTLKFSGECCLEELGKYTPTLSQLC
jgi:hypothetical protein